MECGERHAGNGTNGDEVAAKRRERSGLWLPGELETEWEKER